MRGISLPKKHLKSLNANRVYFLVSFFVYKSHKKLLFSVRVSLLRERNAPYTGLRFIWQVFFLGV